MRTVFVNPQLLENPRRRRRKAKRRAAPKRRRYRKVRGALYRRRRNAGITGFVQNPLIMSPNPRRRSIRRRNPNPLAKLDLKTVVSRGLTYAGGAGISVAANTFFLNKIDNFWMRNGARFGGAVLTAAFLKGDLGASTAGALFYPMMQEMAAKFLGTATATEADLEGLAADLEDVMDDLDDSDLEDGDDDEDMYVEGYDDDDVEEDILS